MFPQNVNFLEVISDINGFSLFLSSPLSIFIIVVFAVGFIIISDKADKLEIASDVVQFYASQTVVIYFSILFLRQFLSFLNYYFDCRSDRE